MNVSTEVRYTTLCHRYVSHMCSWYPKLVQLKAQQRSYSLSP
jgi:hypothetical protein